MPICRRWVAVLVCLATAMIAARGHAATNQDRGGQLSPKSFSGERAYQYTREFVGCGPRWIGSMGHVCAEKFIKKHFAKDDLVEDTFTTNTPAGPMTMHNFIVKFPGKKKGIIVLASHYETNYPLRNIHFVGANDGGSTTGALVEMGNVLRGKTLPGYSVWLVFFDGEEAIQHWSSTDSLYGSRHLAAKWDREGTLKNTKAFLLLDMIGDKNLDIKRETNSTPWLVDMVWKAAKIEGDSKYFLNQEETIEDDHLPFVHRGVPSVDIIDIDYGPHSMLLPDGYHHTAQDTMDKISAHSIGVAGQTVLETIRLLNQR